MSKVAITGNAAGTGTFTIAAPNSNTDRTLALPDTSGTLATDSSTLAQFNASGSAPVFAARAWVNFNGTGTVAIRASGNVSSITDNGVGDYTVNFTTAMSDADYAAACGQFGSTANVIINGENSVAPTTAGIRIGARATATSALIDMSIITVAIFRYSPLMKSKPTLAVIFNMGTT